MFHSAQSDIIPANQKFVYEFVFPQAIHRAPRAGNHPVRGIQLWFPSYNFFITETKTQSNRQGGKKRFAASETSSMETFFFSVLAVHILMEQEEGANEIPAERILNQDAPSVASFFFSRNHAGIKLNGIPDY